MKLEHDIHMQIFTRGFNLGFWVGAASSAIILLVIFAIVAICVFAGW